MNSFIYDIPVKVYFGDNQLQHIGGELGKYGKRVLLTYGGGSIRRTTLCNAVMDKLKKAVPGWLGSRVSTRCAGADRQKCTGTLSGFKSPV